MPKQLNKDISTFETVSSEVNKNTDVHQHTDTLLSPSKAFQAGAQLWLVTDYQHSSWTPIMDWYVNFQITKNRQKKNTTSKQTIPSPLLIGSSDFLNCQQLLELPYTKHWLNQAYIIWSSLNSPSLRVFVPKPLTISEAQKQWSESIVQFVPELQTKH